MQKGALKVTLHQNTEKDVENLEVIEKLFNMKKMWILKKENKLNKLGLSCAKLIPEWASYQLAFG